MLAIVETPGFILVQLRSQFIVSFHILQNIIAIFVVRVASELLMCNIIINVII